MPFKEIVKMTRGYAPKQIYPTKTIFKYKEHYFHLILAENIAVNKCAQCIAGVGFWRDLCQKIPCGFQRFVLAEYNKPVTPAVYMEQLLLEIPIITLD